MTRNSSAKMAKEGSKTAVAVSVNDNDAPLLPVSDLEKLHQFRPDAIDWFFRQTEKEAEHRRKQERIAMALNGAMGLCGQIFGLLIGLCGVAGGGYVALHGSATAGATIASVTIGTLAVAFLSRRGSGKE